MSLLSKLNHKYPQNYILKNPLPGSLIFAVFCFVFMIVYRPLKTHASLNLSYALTMAIYMFSGAVSVYILIKVVTRIPFFSNKTDWTITKEIVCILLILCSTGITTYFMAFLMEAPVNRWNIGTFLDSCKYVLFVGIFPFGLFSLLNYKHLFTEEETRNYAIAASEAINEKTETKICIISQLKKEELSFFPHQLLYAESEGNYVKFYLNEGEKIRTSLIRNSMGEIEKQLAVIPYFIRIHRAFIVNIKKIASKKGNTLGYRLKIYGSDIEIPVSRTNVTLFEQRMEQFR